MVGHRAARDAGVMVIFRYIGAAFSLATTAVSARELGPEGFGLVALVFAYPTLVSSLVGVKSVSVTIRYLTVFRVSNSLTELRSMCKVGYVTDAAAAFAGFLVVVATAPLVAQHLLDLPRITPWMIVYSIALVVGSLAGTGRSIMTAFHRFTLLGLLQPLEKILSFCFVIAALAVGGGMESVAMAMAAAVAISGLASATLASRLLRRETGGGWLSADMRKVAPLRNELLGNFGWNYVIATLAGGLMQLPTLILGSLASAVEAGFLRLALAAVSQIGAVESSLWNIAYPKLSSRWTSEGAAGIRSSLRRWVLHAGAPLSALVVIAAFAAPYLVDFVLGADYGPMVRGLQIMMLGAAISLACFFVAPVYFAMGRLREWALYYGVYVACAVILSVLLGQAYGFVGVAASLGLTNVVFNLAISAWTVRLLNRSLESDGQAAIS